MNIDQSLARFLELLNEDLRRWEEEIQFWENPNILEPIIEGSKSKRLSTCKARAEETRKLIAQMREDFSS